ncbi:DEAD/DEAH box helicase [Paenibacillus wenxiniae]|uniref:SNF2 helicase associated domain-containing protein n=1 Tax=Paenibacillus wenxiniae TaxID=1636843 RepID=A0ABW4RN06_9BACL
MSDRIRTQSIQRLCGSTSYHKGMTMYRTGKVGFTRYDDESGEYEAVVQSRRHEVEHVQIRVSEDEQIDATCSCPSLASYRYHCQHIAATLIYIHECEQRGEPPLLIAPTAAFTQGSSMKRNERASERSSSAQLQSAFEATEDAASSANVSATKATSHIKATRTTNVASATNASLLSKQDLYAKDERLTDELLHLFTQSPRRAAVRRRYLETRDPLALDVICHPLASGNGQYRIGIELRIGPTRTFIVRHIRRLLDSIRIGESYAVTSRFVYDPELHSFAAGDDLVLRQLIQIAEDEQPADAAARTQAGRRGERLLSVPVSHWPALLAALRSCRSVYVAQPDGKELSIVWSQGPLPLQFQLDQSDSTSKQAGKIHPDEKRYVLRVQGLQPLIILESYEAVLNGAELVELDDELCRRLGGLQRLLDRTGTGEMEHQLHLSAPQLEPFVRQVVPELMKLGAVHLTRGVSDRIMQTPLQARLYLDRVRDRLLAGLEFQYGSLTINPLEPEPEGQAEDRIVLRDGEREAQILQLMDEADFTVTEGGYFLTDEEAEYTFLYHIVPRLEKLLHVYATSIVKAMLQNPLSPPKLTVQTDQRHDWLEIRFALDGIPESEIVHVLESLQEQRRYHRLPGGAFLPLEDRAFQQIADFIRRTGMAAPGTGVMEAEEGVLFRLPVLYGLERLDMQDENEAIRFDRSLRRLLESMEQPGRQHEPVPAALESVLRDYQHEGYQWMRTLARYGFGGILADDMGLGKTLQSIAFIASMQDEIRRSGRPVLVVTPASLVYNWQYELKRFAPELRVLLVDGSKAERAVRWQQVLAQEPDMEGMSAAMTEPTDSSSVNARSVQPIDVVITSYPLLRQDRELATSHAYHTLILDEAQNVKNALTHAARAVKELQAKHRFALTGTPIENSLQELWSIMSIVMPGLLGTRREFNDLLPETIARRVRPFILRRMKTDVLHELPDKQEITLVSELLPEQKVLYAAYLAQLQQDALKHLYDPDSSDQQIRIFAGLTRLRQLCCDPGLFVEDYTGGSGKLDQLLELVQDYRDSGRRMLIFSQFTGMLKRIGKKLQERHTPFFYLDGSTASAERLELCHRFNAGEQDVFLISLKAGGTGLNLTGADTVILYDLWWNPAVEEQAADRAYRMGQQRNVQVIRLITRGTVEEKVLELQHNKRELVSEIIQPGQAKLSSLTEQDIRELLLL